jgi:hypothetical protein
VIYGSLWWELDGAQRWDWGIYGDQHGESAAEDGSIKALRWKYAKHILVRFQSITDLVEVAVHLENLLAC